ncbi:MAG: hypothetical protein DMF69_19635 [Acidobacteria bacterium]|nr:MAG: hypothetical protein DMF69_19635 [Acidobacteriota bacterium]
MNEDLTNKLPKRDSEKLDLIVTAVQALTSKTTSLEGNFALMQLRFDAIDSQVQALDKKVEERLYDTRPIWDQVVANVALLQEGQQRIEKTLEDSRNESRESRTVLRDILRRMSIFNDTLVTIQADYRDIYDRVRHLELRNT